MPRLVRDLIRAALGFALALVMPAPALGARVFGPSAKPPLEYVLQTVDRHPVVLLGEAHWTRHDARFVRSLVRPLAERGVGLAAEFWPASEQEQLDRLLAASEWDAALAMRLMRVAAWPYREYLDILHESWRVSRERPGSMRVLGLAPDADWRERKISYDGFMADRVSTEVAAGRHVLVYCGIHHAFTRYHQPELDLAGQARSFMDRAGNILRRRFGERVFLVTLHRPVWCGKEPWSYCLPLDGAIDCVAAGDSGPVGFDVATSSFADRVIDPSVYYAHGYPRLRLDELTDGIVWLGPIEFYELVELIPLDEYAPDETALAEVVRNNPFSSEPGMTREQLAALWSEEQARRADPLEARGFGHLRGWRGACRQPEPGSATKE
jgi:hypothetical protein